MLTFVSKAGIKYSDNNSLTGRQVRCKNTICDTVCCVTWLKEVLLTVSRLGTFEWQHSKIGKSRANQRASPPHMSNIWEASDFPQRPGDTVSQSPSNVNKDALCRTLQVFTQDKRLVYLILWLFIPLCIDFSSKCVFSDLPVYGSLHRFCPATGGSALAHSGPIRGLDFSQLAGTYLHGPITWPSSRSGDGSDWLTTFLKQMKTKANEAVGRPCQLSLCVQVWEHVASGKKNRIYFVTALSVYVCVRESETLNRTNVKKTSLSSFKCV